MFTVTLEGGLIFCVCVFICVLMRLGSTWALGLWSGMLVCHRLLHVVLTFLSFLSPLTGVWFHALRLFVHHGPADHFEDFYLFYPFNLH